MDIGCDGELLELSSWGTVLEPALGRHCRNVTLDAFDEYLFTSSLTEQGAN